MTILKTPIGEERGHLCVIGAGETIMEAFGEAVMNAVLPTYQQGANASRANVGFHIQDKNEKEHVFLSLALGYDIATHLAQIVGQEQKANNRKFEL